MGTYRNQRMIITICLISICLLPLLSACVAAMPSPKAKMNEIMLINEQGIDTNSLGEIGQYTIVVDHGIGEPQISYRFQEEEKHLSSIWNEENKQWEAAVDFQQVGSYQIVVKWFDENQLLEEWVSDSYQMIDVDAMLISEQKSNTSLYLQLVKDEGLKATVQIEDKKENQLHSITQAELLQGFLFQQEGEWEITIQFVNEEGAVLIKKLEDLTIDHTNPYLAIKVDDFDLTKGELPLQAQPLSVTLTAFDQHLNSDSLSVYINDKAQKIEWELINDTYQAKLLLNQDGVYTIQLAAQDHFNNMASISSTTITLDQSAPKIHLFIDDKEVEKLSEFIDHEAILKCVIEDFNFDANASVIIDNENSYNRWQQHENTWSMDLTLKEGTHDIRMEAVDLLQHQTIRNEKITVDSIRPLVFIAYDALDSYRNDTKISFVIKDEHFKPDDSMIRILYNHKPLTAQISWQETTEGMAGSFIAEDEGSYQIQFKVFDSAGNAAIYSNQDQLSDIYEHTFLLDKTAPSINVSFTQQKMTANDQMVNITVQDDYLLKENIQLELEKDHQKYSLTGSWQMISGGFYGSYEFCEAGNYALKVYATDKAGNKSEVKSYEFIIDKQEPLILIKRKPQMFFNKPLPFSIQIDDTYLKHYEIQVLRDHKQIELYSGSDSFHQSLIMDQDGEYEIIASGYDQAGNRSEQRDYFVIDQSAPVLKASFNELPAAENDRFISNQNVVLKLKWEDQNLKDAKIQITKNGKSLPLSYHDQYLTYEFQTAENNEDTYQISVFLSDKAGNQSEIIYELLMDTYLPPISLAADPFKGKARNIAWTPHLFMENKAFQISDVTLYRNQQMVPSYHWGDEISDDGHYLLSVSIRDEAMNEATLIPPFAFTIDTTSPIVEILEAQRMEPLLNQNVSIDTELRLYLSDALSENINIHTLMLEDKKLLKSDRRQDENGLWYYPISFFKEGKSTLFIDVSDEANNHTKQLITYYVLPNLTKEQVKTVAKKEALPAAQSSFDYRAVWILGTMASALLFMIVGKLYAEKH